MNVYIIYKVSDVCEMKSFKTSLDGVSWEELNDEHEYLVEITKSWFR